MQSSRQPSPEAAASAAVTVHTTATHVATWHGPTQAVTSDSSTDVSDTESEDDEHGSPQAVKMNSNVAIVATQSVQETAGPKEETTKLAEETIELDTTAEEPAVAVATDIATETQLTAPPALQPISAQPAAALVRVGEAHTEEQVINECM